LIDYDEYLDEIISSSSNTTEPIISISPCAENKEYLFICHPKTSAFYKLLKVSNQHNLHDKFELLKVFEIEGEFKDVIWTKHKFVLVSNYALDLYKYTLDKCEKEHTLPYDNIQACQANPHQEEIIGFTSMNSLYEWDTKTKKYI
jgi:hypothetical protein